MKKRSLKCKSIIFMSIISMSFMMTACSSSSSKETSSSAVSSSEASVSKSTSESASSSSTSSENTSSGKSESKVTGLQQKYLDRMAELEKKEKDIDPGSKSTTVEMKTAQGDCYKLYDDELNAIYAELKGQLSETDMAALEKEEVQWIKDKEKKADEDSAKYKGGTLEGVEKIASLTNSTKERCYELINKYMPK